MSELTSLLFLQGCLIVPEGSREKRLVAGRVAILKTMV